MHIRENPDFPQQFDSAEANFKGWTTTEFICSILAISMKIGATH